MSDIGRNRLPSAEADVVENYPGNPGVPDSYDVASSIGVNQHVKLRPDNLSWNRAFAVDAKACLLSSPVTTL